ncbi:hypothetical protein B0F87_11331 [Methylobacter tundripaludum]|uniref:PKD domain-containing protein n=1 Tax=Methylobacter tundripaludum TaxID=173365 RepID=A0A2S6H928_9GAMM|nr:hypothetical protein [Methylobacter tundripaludum]PPK73920.1 hypothetical protein B0F87_11331 [Methylobacter tundripaludum]
MKTLNIVVTLVFVALMVATISCSSIDSQEQRTSSDSQSNSGVLQVARQVVEALKAKDGKKLASLVHPEKGVRFSPGAYVDVTSDVVFSRAQIETFWTDERIYTWGFADGTGDSINMTPSQYSREYIMSRDFLSPSSINVNSDRAAGNTTNNANLIYPNGTRVEYYIEPTIRNGVPDLDWAALRLVFERSGNSWFLIAVIHDEWTT